MKSTEVNEQNGGQTGMEDGTYIAVILVLLILITALLALTTLSLQEGISEIKDSLSVSHVDDLTGCQYLKIGNSGITPRLDKDGNQIGCKELALGQRDPANDSE